MKYQVQIVAELNWQNTIETYKKIVKAKFLNIVLIVFYWLSTRLCWLVGFVYFKLLILWYKRFQVATGRQFLAIQSQENNLRNIWKSDYLPMLIFGVGNYCRYDTT